MDDVKGRIHQNHCEQGFHIIGGHTLPLLKLDGLDLLHEILAVPDVVGEPHTSDQRMLIDSFTTL